MYMQVTLTGQIARSHKSCFIVFYFSTLES